jgi:hypothetical protein
MFRPQRLIRTTPMTPQRTPTRHGLTLLELMLSLAITVMVAGGVAAMLGAVSSGVELRRDTRSHMLHANAAQIRLAAYIHPSLCILDATDTDLTLWFNDARPSGTVHTREIRWLRFDENDGIIRVFRVQFPDDWTNNQILTQEREMSPSTNWDGVFDYYQSQGWMAQTVLLDGLASVDIALNRDNPQQSKQVTFRLQAGEAQTPTLVSASIKSHRSPQ